MFCRVFFNIYERLLDISYVGYLVAYLMRWINVCRLYHGSVLDFLFYRYE